MNHSGSGSATCAGRKFRTAYYRSMSTWTEQRDAVTEPRNSMSCRTTTDPLAQRERIPVARLSALNAGEQSRRGADCRFDSRACCRGTQLRARVGDRQHARRRVPRIGAIAPRRRIIARERRYVQPGRILSDADARTAKLCAVHARALVRPRGYSESQLACAGWHAPSRAGGRLLRVVRRADRGGRRYRYSVARRRAHRSHRFQRAGLRQREPHAVDYARSRHANRCG